VERAWRTSFDGEGELHQPAPPFELKDRRVSRATPGQHRANAREESRGLEEVVTCHTASGRMMPFWMRCAAREIRRLMKRWRA
jgi:hypothetical protein